MSGFNTNKRAITDKQKKDVLDRLFVIWTQKDVSQMRFMQLVSNALHKIDTPAYYIEDEDLCEIVEEHYGKEH